MKKIIFCSLLLLSISFVRAQKTEIVITGNIIDDTGIPFAGVSIMARGTTLGTVTDSHGDFSLSLPAGQHTVVILFIGYRNAEIVVDKSEKWDVVFYDNSIEATRHAINSLSTEPVFSHELRRGTDGQGTFYMRNDMPANSNLVSASRIKSIKPSGNGFEVKHVKDKEVLSGKKISYTSSSALSSVGRLPGYVNENSFFRNSLSFGNALSIKTSAFGLSKLDIALGQHGDNSPIPNANREIYNASLGLKGIRTGYVTTDIGVLYNYSSGKLSQQGSNISTLMHSVFTTSDLIDNLPDREKNEYLMSFIKAGYRMGDIIWQNNVSFDKSWNKLNTGTSPNLSPQRTSMREDDIMNILFTSGFEWHFVNDVLLYTYYNFRHTNDKLSHTNELTPVITSFEKEQIRNSHNIKYGFRFSERKILFEIANGHYFSSTAQSKDYVNLFPEFGLRIRDFMGDIFLYNGDLSLFANIKRGIGEVSLVDRNPAILSTIFESTDFRNYYESQLPVYSQLLKPETYVKSEVGLSYNAYEFSIEISGYNSNTHNLTAPVMENSMSIMKNVGRLQNYGYYIALSYDYRSRKGFDTSMKYRFSQGKTRATAIYGDEPFVRLGGFSDIATVLAKGQPMGAIYGISYQRNDDGQIITDHNGIPVINTNLSKIGDPTPDFTMSLNPILSYQKYALSFNFEYSHGSDRWNGTKAFMNQGIIGEEYIEKVNILRMSDVSLKYTLRPYRKRMEQMSVVFSARNLLLATSYNGTDPATRLFGYSLNNGLDLFNSPSQKSFHLSINFTF